MDAYARADLSLPHALRAFPVEPFPSTHPLPKSDNRYKHKNPTLAAPGPPAALQDPHLQVLDIGPKRTLAHHARKIKPKVPNRF